MMQGNGIGRSWQGAVGRQRGMSLLGLIFTAFVVFFIAILLMKVVPLYLADQKITSIFHQLKDFSGDRREIVATIDKQLDINEIDDRFSAKDFKIQPAGNGGYNVTFNYEGRAAIFGNLSIVADFKHQAHVSR